MSSQITEPVRKKIIKKIRSSTCLVEEAGFPLLDEQTAISIGKALQTSLKQVYAEALKLEISPKRYFKNQHSISFKEQIALSEATIVVAGAGGLGGHVVHLLARAGIGTLYIFDHDIFDESNLNRQLFSSTENIGQFKAEVAKQMVNAINPAVDVFAFPEKISTRAERLNNVDIIVDALDNAADRLSLGKLAESIGIPLVHGSIAGFEGRIVTQYPGGNALQAVFGDSATGKSAEETLGTPAIVPSIIGSLQAMEVIKIILKKQGVFDNSMLYLDLQTGVSQQFHF